MEQKRKRKWYIFCNNVFYVWSMEMISTDEQRRNVPSRRRDDRI